MHGIALGAELAVLRARRIHHRVGLHGLANGIVTDSVSVAVLLFGL